MFGKNQVVGPYEDRSGQSLNVHELSPFYTIQGEGPDAGRTAIFVRLAKCNLRCYFCDTEFERGKEWETFELVQKIAEMSREHRCSLVVITGGEPLLQNIVPLVNACNSLGIACSVETAGTMFYPQLREVFTAARTLYDNLIVCSPKTPKIHPELEMLVGAWKYIIRDSCVDMHGLPNMSTQIPGATSPIYKPRHVIAPIYVQPMDEQDDAKNAANLRQTVQSVLNHGYRLGIQMHKLANVE